MWQGIYVCTLFYVNVGYMPYKMYKKNKNCSKTVQRDQEYENISLIEKREETLKNE